MRTVQPLLLTATLLFAAAPALADATRCEVLHGDPAGFPDPRALDTAPWRPALERAALPTPGTKSVWWRIQLAPATTAAPYVYLPALPPDHELYADGARIAGAGSIDDPSAGELFSTWAVVNAPKSGVLAVRVPASSKAGCPSTVASASRQVIGRVLDASAGPLSAGMILLLIGVLSLRQGLRRRDRASLTVAAFCGVSAIITICVSPLHTIVPTLASGPARALTLLAFGLSAPLVAASYRASVPAAGRLFDWLAIGGAGIGLLVAAGAIAAPEHTSVLIWFLVPIALIASPAILVSAGRGALRGEGDAQFVVAAIVVYFACIGHDSVQFATGAVEAGAEGGSLYYWGFVAMAFAFAGIVVRRSLGVGMRLDEVTRGLEARMRVEQSRTLGLHAQGAALASAASQLRATSDAQVDTTNRQAAAIEETRVTAEEIRFTSATASEKAQELLQRATSADEAARDGEKALERTHEVLASIRLQVSEIGTAVAGLEPLTREISVVVDTVKDLATQCGILALNAAIESARAGATSSGFDSVAQEVRHLADQSLQATLRIREIIDRVGERVRDANDGRVRGEQRVAGSTAQVERAAEVLKQLSEMVRESSASVRQISAAVTQQNAGITQIFGALEEIGRQAEETTRQVQELGDSAASVERVLSSLPIQAADEDAITAALSAA